MSDIRRGIARGWVGGHRARRRSRQPSPGSARPEGDGHRVRTDSVDAPAKKRRALELLAEQRLARTGVVSLQVMQEYFVAATRKLASRRTLAAGKPGTSGVP